MARTWYFLLLFEIKSSFDDDAFRFALRGIVSRVSDIFLDRVTTP